MSKKNMARATLIVAILGILSKIMGFMREQLIAWFFGATGLTDAYLVALAIPTVLTGLISNPVSTAFLPVFASYVAQDDKKVLQRLLHLLSPFQWARFCSLALQPGLLRHSW